MSDTKKEMIKYAKIFYKKGMVDSAGGNLSARDKDKIFITKRDSSINRLWDYDESCFVEAKLSGEAVIKKMQPLMSRESHLHFRIFNEFSHVNSIFHIHPRYLLGFASLKIDMPIVTALARDRLFPSHIKCIRDEQENTISESIAIVRYFKYLYNNSPDCGLACLLSGHGIVVAGKNLKDTFMKVEVLENNARTFYYMQLIEQSNYYKEFRREDSKDIYGDWDHIQRTGIKDVKLYFEREDVDFSID